MIKGKQSIAFKASPYIEESASVVGKKEGEGPLGSRFDMVGLDENGNMVIGDEMLTPDSSRFWPVEGYEPKMKK